MIEAPVKPKAKSKTVNHNFLKALKLKQLSSGASTGVDWLKTSGEVLHSYSPVDSQLIGSVKQATKADLDKILTTAESAFKQWRLIPAPKRGEIVRQMGNELRNYKEPLGQLVSYEMGKSLQEGLGEVQEMIDICDFAVGLSRQLYGLTMHSERPNHRMYEQYHPLGVVGVVSAFNFPVAVWSWNAMLALVCGDVVLWKPSSKARLPLLSVTGSTRVGRHVAKIVGERFGKTILELGGNNAIIISENANLDIAIRAVAFGAVGTAGQRCTSTRRLIIHEKNYNKVKERLLKVYSQLTIGDPLDSNNHVGPLIDKDAVRQFTEAIQIAQAQGGKILFGGQVMKGKGYESGCYVQPCMIEVKGNLHIVKEETFAPILYLMKYKNLDDAIHLQNDVPQGLSSAIFTENILEAEKYLSTAGSDCGIANVNIGTSGAEIGGAFGGEKETGGGRESGSDSWKLYMRRQTNTINYGSTLPLAQGIKFDV